MATTTLLIRPARRDDAQAITQVHDEAWREAYRGIIGGVTLERMVEQRGPAWWRQTIGRGAQVLVLDFGGRVAGYVSFGRARERSAPYPAQIYELYLKPEFQGLGFGTRLFHAARQQVSSGRRPLVPMVVYALTANERALAFYRKLGGRELNRRSEQHGGEAYETLGFAFGGG